MAPEWAPHVGISVVLGCAHTCSACCLFLLLCLLELGDTAIQSLCPGSACLLLSVWHHCEAHGCTAVPRRTTTRFTKTHRMSNCILLGFLKFYDVLDAGLDTKVHALCSPGRNPAVCALGTIILLWMKLRLLEAFRRLDACIILSVGS
jgi:hypothetical protein